jgi:hypothetical protein
MRKLLILSAAAAAIGLFALIAPANAAGRNSTGVANAQSVQLDLSAHRYHRRYYYHRHYRYYGHYHYYRRYYGGPYYYYPYPYYYRPRAYYYGYYPYYYYRRPGIYFSFGW